MKLVRVQHMASASVLLALAAASCSAESPCPKPGVYLKCPVAERPGAPRKPGFTARIEARYSVTQDSAKQPTWLIRDDCNSTDDYNTRRLRMCYSGQVGHDLLYFGQLRRDWGADEFAIRDLYVTWSGWGAANVSVGQMKTPIDRQYLTSDVKLPLAERPRISKVLAPDRDIGILLHDSRSNDRFGWYAGVYTGNGQNELNSYGTFMPAARVEWLPTPSLNVGLNWVHNDSPRKSEYQRFLKKNKAYGLQDLYQAEKLDEELWGVDLLHLCEYSSIWAGYTTKDVSGPAGAGVEADGWYVNATHYVPFHGHRDRLELVVAYEEFDPNRSVVDQLDARWFTLGCNYHIEGCKRQVRLQYVFRDEKRDDVNNSTLMVQYDHMFD